MNDIKSLFKESNNFTAHPLCTINLYKIHIKEWKEHKNKILSLMYSCFNSTREYIDDPLISYTDYFNSVRMEYAEEFIPIVKPYLQKFNPDSVYKFRGINGIWAQRYYANDFHAPHDHGTLGYSCVFYAKFDPKVHSSTMFLPPFSNAYGKRCLTDMENIIEGDLLIFPSNITHMSTPHKSDIDRVIISFNLT